MNLDTNKNLKIFLLIFGILLIFASGYLLGQQKKNQEVLSSQTKPNSSPTVSSALSPLGSKTLYQVIKVIDGDTIDISINGKTETLRLIGIDTPETVDPRKTVQCFGKEASQKAKETLTGKNVYLESDPTQGDLDKYKRLLRYVFLEDGTNFNLMMIAYGFAHEYTYNLPYKYQTEFKAAQNSAMQKELGLWSPSSCSGETTSSDNPDNTDSSLEIPKEELNSSYKPTGTYACNCSKLCGAIKTCDEAYYQLQNCGCSTRDSDGDGVPCESLCK